MEGKSETSQVSLFTEDDPRSADERRLLELFRLLPDVDKAQLLISLSMQVLIELSKSAIPSSANPVMLPSEEDEADPTDFADEFLFGLKPPQEPWDYLDEYMASALEHAWPNGVADAILGSAANDEYNAADLMGAVEVYAEDASSEEPWFGEKEMSQFILAWRQNFMGALKRLQRSSHARPDD